MREEGGLKTSHQNEIIPPIKLSVIRHRQLPFPCQIESHCCWRTVSPSSPLASPGPSHLVAAHPGSDLMHFTGGAAARCMAASGRVVMDMLMSSTYGVQAYVLDMRATWETSGGGERRRGRRLANRQELDGSFRSYIRRTARK